MAVLIATGDFVGKYTIVTNNTVAIQKLIDDTERRMLKDLLGESLYTLFIADIGTGGVPSDPDYVTIYDELRINHKVPVDDFSTGMKEMLLAMVWYQWNNDVQTIPTQNGLKNIESSNSKAQGTNTFTNKRAYNLAIANYKVIQFYIQQNSDIYGDIKYIHKDYTF
jgi:hypothetical protein